LNEKHACPLCKHSTDIGNVFFVSNVPNLLVSRIENLRKILGSKEIKKIVIYSVHDDESFNDVNRVLHELSIPFWNLCRTGCYATTTVKTFQEYPTSYVLLVNSRLKFGGLNLDTATDLILFDRLDPLRFDKFVGLANRPGRVKPLNVWHIMNVGEF
jgi:hypothetical protein